MNLYYVLTSRVDEERNYIVCVCVCVLSVSDAQMVYDGIQ